MLFFVSLLNSLTGQAFVDHLLHAMQGCRQIDGMAHFPLVQCLQGPQIFAIIRVNATCKSKS